MRPNGVNAGLKAWQAQQRAYAQCRDENSRAYVSSPEFAAMKERLRAKAIEDRAALIRHHAAKRRASKRLQCPPWANLEAIKSVYRLAQKMTRETGIKYHVDHVYPLSGKLVSGLHVAENLQILTSTENVKKHNHFEVEP